METCANYLVGEDLFFSSDERKWITKIRRLAEQHPDEVMIIAQPETNDGCIYARMPASYLQIQAKRRVNLSDEQRIAATERLAKARQKRTTE